MERLPKQEYVFSLLPEACLDEAVADLVGFAPVEVIDTSIDTILARMEPVIYASVFLNGRGDRVMPTRLGKHFLYVEPNESYKHL